MQMRYVKISSCSRRNNVKQNMYLNVSFTCIRSIRFSTPFTFRTNATLHKVLWDFYYYFKSRRCNAGSFTILKSVKKSCVAVSPNYSVLYVRSAGRRKQAYFNSSDL